LLDNSPTAYFGLIPKFFDKPSKINSRVDSVSVKSLFVSMSLNISGLLNLLGFFILTLPRLERSTLPVTVGSFFPVFLGYPDLAVSKGSRVLFLVVGAFNRIDYESL
jgi:hypothetical protein